MREIRLELLVKQMKIEDMKKTLGFTDNHRTINSKKH